jgi:cation diffusion facilitator CzcD-associated flavoprotein CzcO
VGGTWYWNRYPGARFDSESYTYAYLFSRELFEDWEWQEHFAEQPEIERYLNHVVDRFDLRRHMRFGARVTSAVYDDSSGKWTVVTSDGTESGRGSWWRPPASSRCRTSPTCRGGRTSRASRTTRVCGRRRRSTSPTSASRSSAPDRAACR